MSYCHLSRRKKQELDSDWNVHLCTFKNIFLSSKLDIKNLFQKVFIHIFKRLNNLCIPHKIVGWT